MSGNYYKKVKTPPPPNSYGFKQVNSRELQDILKRVTRSTYSAKLHTEEQRQLNNYEHLLTESGRRRVASACGHRSGVTGASRISSATTTDSGSYHVRPRRMTEREMNKLIKNLQRPTTATTLHAVGGDHSNIAYDNELKAFYKRIGNQKPPVSPKTIAKLRRPTTATIAKTLNECHLCYDHEHKKKKEELDAFDYDYSDDKVVPAEEVDYIVGRVSAPTYASNKGQHSCGRLPVYIDEVKIRDDLPLLSGLRRSKNVREITERLFPSRKHRGMTPQATVITTY